MLGTPHHYRRARWIERTRTYVRESVPIRSDAISSPFRPGRGRKIFTPPTASFAFHAAPNDASSVGISDRVSTRALDSLAARRKFVGVALPRLGCPASQPGFGRALQAGKNSRFRWILVARSQARARSLRSLLPALGDLERRE